MELPDHAAAPPDGAPELMWRPDPATMKRSRMAAFRRMLQDDYGLDLPAYDDLWDWSVAEPEAFWDAFATFFEVDFHDPPERALE